MLLFMSDELMAVFEKTIKSENKEVITEAVHQAVRDYIEKMSTD